MVTPHPSSGIVRLRRKPLMIRIPDDELEALATGLGSDRVERKERLAGDAPTRLREAICALANDMPGHGKAGRGDRRAR